VQNKHGTLQITNGTQLNKQFTLHLGDCRDVLKAIPDNSIDAIVTDPPYELGFMGKSWDNSGIAYNVDVWREVFRVAKPGAHIIAFGGSRTYHRLACAIEDAGWEIRDQIQWIYGSGFPKSLDIAKQMDKNAGIWRGRAGEAHEDDDKRSFGQHYERTEKGQAVTENAKQWDGWGTALKPAHEPAVLARKPIVGNVVNNVNKWGVGGLNIDGTRIGVKKHVPSSGAKTQFGFGLTRVNIDSYGTGYNKNIGRWPANIIFDDESAKLLDEQAGIIGDYRDPGSASRFFYNAKSSAKERDAGLDDYELVVGGAMKANQKGELGNGKIVYRKNSHPTVKPINLMQYLVRLITPKGGVVLDPFMGSGSTGCACMMEQVQFVGIDITPEYVDIAQKRIEHWRNKHIQQKFSRE
jgi:site-specific DNA-methyltransferase (adenine-specific)